VVVPLHEDRDLRIEGTKVLVEKIVFVRGTKLVECLRDLGFTRAFLNDSVVATSTIICEGRSARAQMTQPSVVTSPD
jgi:hypothetical protein